MRKSQPKQAECCRYPPESQKQRFWGRVRNNTVAERAATNRSLKTTLSLNINHNLPPPQNFGAHPQCITKGYSLCNLMKCIFPGCLSVVGLQARHRSYIWNAVLKKQGQKCTTSKERATHQPEILFVPLFRTPFLKNRNKKRFLAPPIPDEHPVRRKPLGNRPIRPLSRFACLLYSNFS